MYLYLRILNDPKYLICNNAENDIRYMSVTVYVFVYLYIQVKGSSGLALMGFLILAYSYDTCRFHNLDKQFWSIFHI